MFSIVRLLATIYWLTLVSSVSADPVRIGVLAFRPKSQTLMQWQPLAQVLKKTLPEQDFVVGAYTYTELDAAVAARQLDFILTNPAHYVLVAHRNGLHPPLATITKNDHNRQFSSFGGVIFTRADRNDINTLADISGKTVAITKTESLGGYQMQIYELVEAGLQIPDAAHLLMTGMPHDLTVAAVLSGHADVGFARTGVLEDLSLEGKLDLQRLKIINRQNSPEFPLLLSTRLYPEWPFAALSHVDVGLIRRVAAALFLLEDDSEAAQIMNVQGFTFPADYSVVETLQRRLRIPPFEQQPQFTAVDLWRQYKASLLSAMTAFSLIMLLAFRLLAVNRRLKAKQVLIKAQTLRLKESEELWKFALEGARDGVWDWRIATGDVYFSKRWKAMIGYGEELADCFDSFQNLLHPDDKARVLAKVQSYFEDMDSLFEQEFRLCCKDGSYKWILARGKVVSVDAEGKPLRMVGTHSDISERKQTQIALQSSYDLLVNLAAQVPGALYQYQIFPDGRSCFPFASEGIKEIYEVTPEQVREDGSPVFAVLHPDDYDAIIESVESSARELSPWHLEYRVLLPKQGLRWCLGNARPQRLDDGSVLWHGFITDITERKQVEAALLRSNADLEQFAYSVSHDMRQPLRMVSGHLQLLERELGEKLDDDARTNLNFALDGATRMDAMIVSLLEYSRVGRKTEAKELMASREALDEALHFLEPAIAEVQASLTITGDWPQLYASRDELTRLLQNLIGNALKYHDPNQHPRIEIDAQVNDGCWKVAIKDDGIGIAPSQTGRLFRFFSRLQARSHFDGTGMGLALCRRIVEHHGGRIWVESQGEGCGSIFMFEMPLQQTPAQDNVAVT